MTPPVLIADQISKHYSVARGPFKPADNLIALDKVSFSLERGKTLAIVGESGCGKSTLAQLVSMINPPTSGSLIIDGNEIAGTSIELLKSLRSRVQIVFQNPFGSLNPRQKIGSALIEPLRMNTSLSKIACQEKAGEMIEQVGLRVEFLERYPHMFSGGQRQRIAIARALMLNPKVLVLDEPVSALDVSIQAQILNLLNELQDKHNLAYLFISHDLSVVKHIADEVMVMYLGRTVEKGDSETFFKNPRHPYSQALLASTPVPIPGLKKQRISLEGEIPSPITPPSGCTFHPRCPKFESTCSDSAPSLSPLASDAHSTHIACHVVNRLA